MSMDDIDPDALPDFAVGALATKTFYLKDSLLHPIYTPTHDVTPELEKQIRETWFRPDAVAKCSKDHPIPDKDCKCGLYTFKTAQEAMTQYGAHACFALAILAPEGLSMTGALGFRSPKARIEAIWVRPFALKHNQDLPLNYPSVKFFTTLRSMLAAYPSVDDGGIEAIVKNEPRFVNTFLLDDRLDAE